MGILPKHFVVHWKSNIHGETGKGNEAIDFALALEWVEYLNSTEKDFTHWIEEVTIE